MKTKKVVLEVNYRSTDQILDIATKLISENPEREKKDVRTEKSPGESVILSHYEHETDQAAHIARRIAVMKENDGLKWSDFAILVRRRMESVEIVRALRKAGLPFEIIGSKDYFETPVIRSVMAYLRFIEDPYGEESALIQILLRPVYGLRPMDIRKLTRYAKDGEMKL